MSASPLPIGSKLLVAFFAFGAAMCTLAIALLVFPGTRLDALWRVNPEAQHAFTAMGAGAILLMCSVGVACAVASIGLARGTEWGRWLAIVILTINVMSDAIGAAVRDDPWTLLGVPAGGAMIGYLLWQRGR
ncbi:MAG: hypothetical protein ACJ8KU_02655 [Chthoniobacterales bacterium]